ncbi:hypothetical protein JW960_16555 [candidate division KSB1 bacterium]|nr:hypothetical protein [candidate division KSB1 bacterium]
MSYHIIHMDISGFAVSIARLKDSKLRTRPVVVAVPDMARSLVYAVSPEARQSGIRRGMPLTLAQKMCRDVRVIPPDYGLYSRATQAILKILADFTPTIEPVGYGHAYLDMTGTSRLFGATKDAAIKIQREIENRLSLNSTVGVAGNKLVSKIASTIVRPVGVHDVALGDERHFVAPLSVHYLPTITKPVRQQLQELNLKLIREIAELSVQHLTMAFGKKGLWLHQASHGIDNTPVRAPQRIPNVYQEMTLPEDSNDYDYLRHVLYGMTESATLELRNRNRAAKQLSIEIVYSDHKSAFGQRKLRAASNMTHELFDPIDALFQKTLSRRIRVRQISLRLYQLAPAVCQLSLFDTPVDIRHGKLSNAIDLVRDMFGRDAIRFAGK